MNRLRKWNPVATVLLICAALFSVVDVATKAVAGELTKVKSASTSAYARLRARVVQARAWHDVGASWLIGWQLGARPAIAGGAAASADRLTNMKEATEKAYPVKDATKIFAGTMVALQADGHAVPASDAANLKLVGVADVQADNTDGADGDKHVKVRRGVFRFTASSITQAMVGKIMYVVDDQTFDDAVGTNGIKAGRLVEFISTTEGWIEILGPMGQGVVLADADATYGQAEADLINDLKLKVNTLLAG